MENKKKVNAVAIIGFVFSIISIFTYGFTSAVGLILSIIGLVRAKKYEKPLNGLAIAGLVISAIFIIIFWVTVIGRMTSDYKLSSYNLDDVHIRVANFKGMSKSKTEKWCNSTGASCNIIEEYNDDIEKDELIEQEPMANTVIKKGDNITVKYSLGSKGEDTSAIHNIGETVKCYNFDITVNGFQVKKEGTYIDSYSYISDPEWVGVIITVTNTSTSTHTFSPSGIALQNSNGEIIKHRILNYDIWGVEILNSPKLIPGGSKTGYVSFTNTNQDDSNLILLVSCNDYIILEDTSSKYSLR